MRLSFFIAALAAVALVVDSAYAQQQALPDPQATEISVVGDAHLAAPPDFVIVSVRLEQTAAGGDEALTQLDGRGNALAQAAKGVCENALVRTRGDKFVAATTGPLQLKGTTPITVQRTLAIECASPERAGKIVDAALRSGSVTVTDVAYSSRSGTKLINEAIQLAAKRAQEKATVVATALGVKLGAVIATVVTEEPDGESVREQLQQGQPALDYSDKVQRVYVTVRYSVGR